MLREGKVFSRKLGRDEAVFLCLLPTLPSPSFFALLFDLILLS